MTSIFISRINPLIHGSISFDRLIANLDRIYSSCYIASVKNRSQSDMSDLDRGIMKFKGADSPTAIAISAALVLGGIGVLLWWALHAAYTVS